LKLQQGFEPVSGISGLIRWLNHFCHCLPVATRGWRSVHCWHRRFRASQSHRSLGAEQSNGLNGLVSRSFHGQL